MQNKAQNVDDFLKHLPEDRRQAVAALRQIILKNLPKGYVEVLNYGMLNYEVPLALVPKTYNGKPLMYLGLASQKNHMSLYLCSLGFKPGAEEKFARAWKAKGRKLDMGKACIRFKALEDLDLELIVENIASTSVADLARLATR